MDTLGIVFTVILVVALILVGMYFLGSKLQKKQSESQKLIQQNRQTVSAMIIDKKKIKITEANLPKQAVEGIPRYMKLRKLPMVKVKIGPQILTLLCEGKVFENLPVKKIVKLEVAGAYILGFSTSKKGDKKVEIPRKLTLREKLMNKLNNVSNKVEDMKTKDAKANEKMASASKKKNK